jgi:hypothetical protein
MRPATDPSDAVVYRHQSVTDSQGVQYLVNSRLEWIGYNIYAGADFYMRTAPVCPWAPTTLTSDLYTVARGSSPVDERRGDITFHIGCRRHAGPSRFYGVIARTFVRPLCSSVA